MPSIDVCLSPELLPLFQPEGKIIIVTDILRATSCMVTALAHGIESIIPVASLDECRSLGKQGYVTAAERDGKKADGFDLGNSPFSYMNADLVGKSVAVTTTNGTKAITESVDADEIIIGAFLNLDTVCQYVVEKNKDVIVVCSGWKGHVNMEDTLFAGAVAEILLQNNFTTAQDSTDMATTLWNVAKSDLNTFLGNCSHARRLQNLDITDDIAFCLTLNKFNVLPIMQNGKLVKLLESPELKVQSFQ